MKYKTLVTTLPFGVADPLAIELLENEPKLDYTINPLGRKLRESEILELVDDYDILIAGTEQISKEVMLKARNLKLISRVGIGLDSVDLDAARELGIEVAYTPDAPSKAVADLTIAQMFNLCRKISYTDRKIREGVWIRYMGSLLSENSIGIIGVGRIGKLVLNILKNFEPKEILVNDIFPDYEYYEQMNVKFVPKTEIYKKCNIISLHIPLTTETKNLITKAELRLMNDNAMLINTSRGGIINENDLYDITTREKKGISVAMDVFEDEPYSGKLLELDNVNVTCHMGSCTISSRAAMEVGAVQEVLRFVNGKELINKAPKDRNW